MKVSIKEENGSKTAKNPYFSTFFKQNPNVMNVLKAIELMGKKTAKLLVLDHSILKFEPTDFVLEDESSNESTIENIFDNNLKNFHLELSDNNTVVTNTSFEKGIKTVFAKKPFPSN
jgi:uncharacterized protein YjbK